MAKQSTPQLPPLSERDIGQIATQLALRLRDDLGMKETESVRKEWLNTREAAAYLGVGVETLEIARHLGNKDRTPRGPVYSKWGAKVRYKVTDLDTWMEAHKIDQRR